MDGHAVVRLGVRELLDGRYEVEEASDWRGARDALRDTGAFDVAIVDLDRRGKDGGTTMIRAMRKAMPGIGIVAHARRADRHAASAALEAGASAYVAKSSPPEALEQAVDAAADAGRFVDPAAVKNGRDHVSPLTKRQREILQLLADGLSTGDIADRLGLSAETVRTHTKGLLARLSARDRTHAVAMGLRSGLID